MGMIDNILGRMGYSKAKENYAQWLLATADVEQFNLPDGSMYKNQAELMARLSWVNTAVTILSNTCALQALNVKKREGEKLVDIPNHPFELLLDSPNPMSSRFEFSRDSEAYYRLTGNCYWWMNKPNPTAPPSEMWIIPPNKIRPVPDGKLYLKGYLYDPGDGNEILLQPWEVEHFKTFNPANRFVGLSPIESIAVVAAGDMEMQKTNTRLYGESGGKLPSVLAFADPIPDSDWEKLQREVSDNEKKRRMMMLRNSGAGGVQWLMNAMSNKDMEFLAGRTFTKEEIYNLFAPGLASMLAVNATEANSTAAKETFLEFAVWPSLTARAEKISNGVLKLYGDNLRCEFDDPRKTDRMLELQEMQEYGKTHTINEIRIKWHEDDPLADERGELFPAQITAQMTSQETSSEEPQDTRDLKPQAEPEPEEDEQDMVKAELDQWRAFELKRKGKGRAFKCEYIPEPLERVIRDGLLLAIDDDEINGVFDGESPMKTLKRAMELMEKMS